MKAKPIRLAVLLALVICIAVLLSGCVERTMTIVTEPAGATVYVAGEHKGESPVVMPFDFYGAHNVEIYKKDYKGLREVVEPKVPLYQRVPLDFFAELLFPFTLHDDHRYTYMLAPAKIEDATALRERAEQAKARFDTGGSAAEPK